jgi:uncharacterized protein
MTTANFTFHGDINDFLAHKRRNQTFEHSFDGRVSKDVIEALGVPHTEILALYANARPVDFAYPIEPADRLDIYGFDATLPPGETLPLRPPYESEPRFVLDTHLGQLAVYLRMLGFDTLYRNDYADEHLARISAGEGRILLTRDKGLLKRSLVVYGYYVRETNPQRQIAEITGRYDLLNAIAPLRRCIRCNGLLQAVDKTAIADRLEDNTRQFYDEFSICPSCDQIYWKGTHYESMVAFIAQVLEKTPEATPDTP